MRTALLLLLALPVAALAQHHREPEPARAAASVPRSADPDRRLHWPGAVITPRPGDSLDHASMHALPIGTGIAAKDGGWLRIDETGIYKLHNFSLNEVRDDKGELVKPPLVARLIAGRIYRVMPHRGKAAWTAPNATARTLVPATSMIPPMTAKSGPGRPYP